MTAPGISGGCQCGLVRYRAAGTDDAVLCHCRMCQRAVGNAFGWMVSTIELEIIGVPGWFRSSSAATRGFCRNCGTPLFFQLIDGDRTWVAGGSLDHPEPGAPKSHYGIESQHAWTTFLHQLPGGPTVEGGFTGKTAHRIESYQHMASDWAKEEL